MKLNEYIVLDLETTGLNPARDRIIEFAGIRVKDGEIQEEFEQIIDPEREISAMITNLTGIKNEDVIGKPIWEDMKMQIEAFIGDLPIIGHSVQFDIDFLQNKGIKLAKNLKLDTFQLGTILLPGQRSYALSSLVESLKLDVKATHRAMDDVKSAWLLFETLKERLLQVPRSIREQLSIYTNRSNWHADLLFQEMAKNRRDDKPKKHISSKPALLDDKEKIALRFTEDEVTSHFEESGTLKKTLTQFEKREGQIEMSRAIFEAFNTSSHAMIEAGTGIGKTLAYLIPSIHKARSANTPVVISTNTLNLQKQLFTKDIPLLQKTLGGTTKKTVFNAAILKGAKHYLCLRKWTQFLKQESYTELEITVLLKIFLWVKKTSTGDREELSIKRDENFIWNRLTIDDRLECSMKCSKVKECFLLNAKKRAEKADLIVVNHALLMANSAGSGKIIPEYDYLVIDEGHHLESVATSRFGERLELLSIQQNMKDFSKRLTFLLKTQEKTLLSDSLSIKGIRDINHALPDILSRFDIFFGLLGMYMNKYRDPHSSFKPQALVTEIAKSTDIWIKIKESTTNLTRSLFNVSSMLSNLVSDLESGKANRLPGIDLEEELSEQLGQINLYISSLKSMITEGNEEQIVWIDEPREGALSLSSAPINVGHNLVNSLYQTKNSVIITSATLTIDHSFEYMRTRLGLDDINWNFAEFESPFDYHRQAIVITPEDIPDPKSADYMQKICQVMHDTVVEMKGRTLALFTSHRAIENAFKHLGPTLNKEGFGLLAQGLTGGRNKITQAFMDEPEKSILLGTSSFWEGIDIPGSTLSCVVITKLPFELPTDPIFQARSATYDRPFDDYAVPRAILTFKQGFGRLIRSEKDIGVVIILDTRILTQGYGVHFLRSLPPVTTAEILAKDIRKEIQAFFENS